MYCLTYFTYIFMSLIFMCKKWIIRFTCELSVRRSFSPVTSIRNKLCHQIMIQQLILCNLYQYLVKKAVLFSHFFLLLSFLRKIILFGIIRSSKNDYLSFKQKIKEIGRIVADEKGHPVWKMLFRQNKFKILNRVTLNKQNKNSRELLRTTFCYETTLGQQST